VSFIHSEFLLQSAAARQLYHRYAENQPILDYHNHLSPRDIAEDRRDNNHAEIWLEGDHYKWRALRANGIAEELCTGTAAPYDKFMAWARTVPHTLRNPLYHWTHLELKRFFDIDELLNESSAAQVWARANERLRDPALSARGILKSFGVTALCTTDDPADSLQYHRAIAAADMSTRVYPTFRPDRALAVHQPAQFNAWLLQLGRRTNIEIDKLPQLLQALETRHSAFHEVGCRLSDHGLAQAPSQFAGEAEATAIFDSARAGVAATPQQQARFSGFLMLFLGRLDAARGWTKQLHLGPLRNVNSRAFAAIGPDAGFDTMSDWPQVEGLVAYFNRLDAENALPRTIIYNLNPAYNLALATVIGNFQDGTIAGKMQFGAAWWFLDTRQGIEDQLNALSNVGLLSRFVGMLTDSRSFLSFARHEYFRRVLCNLLGRDMEGGELPNECELVGDMVSRICHSNATEYLRLGS
jgi:glucuronate isomerase